MGRDESVRLQGRMAVMPEEDKDSALQSIWLTLYPGGDLEHEWSPEEIEKVAGILKDAGFPSPEEPFNQAVGEHDELDTESAEKLRAVAKERYVSEEIEIDEGAQLSVGDGGAWVQAWVYVSFEDAGIGEGT